MCFLHHWQCLRVSKRFFTFFLLRKVWWVIRWHSLHSSFMRLSWDIWIVRVRGLSKSYWCWRVRWISDRPTVYLPAIAISRARTRNLQFIPALSNFARASRGIRTPDPRFTKASLYHWAMLAKFRSAGPRSSKSNQRDKILLRQNSCSTTKLRWRVTGGLWPCACLPKLFASGYLPLAKLGGEGFEPPKPRGQLVYSQSRLTTSVPTQVSS